MRRSPGSWRGGVPEKLARRVARLSLLEPALDIVALARAEQMPVADVARVYFELGVLLGLDWLHGEIDRLVVDGSWQATARTSLRDAAMRAHRELTHQVLNTRGAKRVGERVERWSAQRADALAELAAHAHRNARRGQHGFRHAHRGRRGGSRSVERLRNAARAGDHHA